MLRELTMLCFGTLIAPSRFSISTQSTPRIPSSQVSASPTGPAPAIRTEVVGDPLIMLRSLVHNHFMPHMRGQLVHTPVSLMLRSPCRLAVHAHRAHPSP